MTLLTLIVGNGMLPPEASYSPNAMAAVVIGLIYLALYFLFPARHGDGGGVLALAGTLRVRIETLLPPIGEHRWKVIASIGVAQPGLGPAHAGQRRVRGGG